VLAARETSGIAFRAENGGGPGVRAALGFDRSTLPDSESHRG
jgi:hypothetical protein